MKMYAMFTESSRSKLYVTMREPQFEIRHPEQTERGLCFVIILSAAGKSTTRYYLSMGKFTVQLFTKISS